MGHCLLRGDFPREHGERFFFCASGVGIVFLHGEFKPNSAAVIALHFIVLGILLWTMTKVFVLVPQVVSKPIGTSAIAMHFCATSGYPLDSDGNATMTTLIISMMRCSIIRFISSFFFAWRVHFQLRLCKLSACCCPVGWTHNCLTPQRSLHCTSWYGHGIVQWRPQGKGNLLYNCWVVLQIVEQNWTHCFISAAVIALHFIVLGILWMRTTLVVSMMRC